MAFIGQFNAADVQPASASNEIVPAGKYQASIVNSEMRDTKKGGQLLWLEIAITDGEFAGRRVFDRLNLVNDNPKAVEIAQRSLSALCHATGQMSVSDSEQLHGRPFTVTVKVRPADGQYGPQNEIGGYEAPSGTRAAVAGFRPPAPAQSGLARDVAAAEAGAPTKTAAPPWKRTAA